MMRREGRAANAAWEMLLLSWGMVHCITEGGRKGCYYCCCSGSVLEVTVSK